MTTPIKDIWSEFSSFLKTEYLAADLSSEELYEKYSSLFEKMESSITEDRAYDEDVSMGLQAMFVIDGLMERRMGKPLRMPVQVDPLTTEPIIRTPEHPRKLYDEALELLEKAIALHP